MDNRDILKKIYQGGLQDNIEQDEVKIYWNNLRNDCLAYCVKDFSQRKLSQTEKECTKNFLSKNFQLLNINVKGHEELLRQKASFV